MDERRMWALACQFNLPSVHQCLGTIEVWNAQRLVRIEPCPCRCHG